MEPNRLSPVIKTFAFLLGLFIWSSAQADLVLTAPPRESAVDGKKQYGPLAIRLSKVLGMKVSYKQPKSWQFYQRDMRADKYDIVFDGPHFMSWRMRKFHHIPVAKLPGNLEFIVIAKADDREINKLKDVQNVKLCAISPPNLSTLTIMEQFGPVAQLRLKTVKGGMKGVIKAFMAGKCRAAILRDKFYQDKVSKTVRSATKVIFTSNPLPNQGVTVSSRVGKSMRIKISEDLTRINSGTTALLKRFSPRSNKMLPVNSSEYEPYHRLLSEVLFGW